MIDLKSEHETKKKKNREMINLKSEHLQAFFFSSFLPVMKTRTVNTQAQKFNIVYQRFP